MIIISECNYHRDLTLPMGAQNKTRLQHYIYQYEMLNEQVLDSKGGDSFDEHIPPYFYGSHYSTALGCVLYFLLRKEPFTSLHVCLQDNHFDVADRLFFSLPVTTRSCLENIPEIKEVVPEFYTDDSYLVNMNKQQFGVMQVILFAMVHCRMEWMSTMWRYLLHHPRSFPGICSPLKVTT